MKVLHTISSMGEKWGGLSMATFELLSAINKLDMPNGDAVDLLSFAVSEASDDNSLAEGRSWYLEVASDGITPYKYSQNMRRFLRESDYDVYHVNGLWRDVNHVTCTEARKKGKPYVITPHGMLYPEALKRSAWEKRVLRKFLFDKDIFVASCIHATCDAEMTHIRALGYDGPIAKIGNPVFCPAIADKLLAEHSFHSSGRPVKLGFLGRLHPGKKVENLLYAVALRPDLYAEVVIMGTESPEYEDFLRSEAKRLGIAERVRFLGFVTGDAKFEQLARLDALFVPSDMENFGMIIPEALMVGTPVMASLGTPWKSLNRERCGWWVDNSPECIAGVIDTIAASSSEELREMGLRGRRLVLTSFESSLVASSMYHLYKWLTGSATKPEFVYYD